MKPADLQSAAIAARRLTRMVEPAGIEPATPNFQSDALPAELRFQMAEAEGLEPPDGFPRRFSRPVRYQLRSMLPYVVGATGLEPATTRLKVGCSNPTELRSHKFGGARRTRI